MPALKFRITCEACNSRRIEIKTYRKEGSEITMLRCLACDNKEELHVQRLS